MPNPVIICARQIITMDPAQPEATAVAVGSDGRIAAVGDRVHCSAVLPEAPVVELGDDVLLPGFVESHSHPLLAGITTQPPAYWIAPYVGYATWSDVTALFDRVHVEQPDGKPLLFNGLDRLLHGVDAPTNTVLDAHFPGRPVVVVDNSGHAAYFTSAAIDHLGWSAGPPADPVGGSFGRNPDGSSNGQAFELPAVMVVADAMLADLVANPLASAAQWYALMAANGITTTAEMTYETAHKPAFEALASLPGAPLRVSVYHVSTASDCGEPWVSDVPEGMLSKGGIKLWADGSPWMGNIATTFPYLDTPTTRAAGIAPGIPGLEHLNYTRAELDDIIDRHAARGWQLAFHINGDAALDVVLDACEAGLARHGLVGTDHRWRLEHLGAARTDQLDRAAGLGLYASLAPFHIQYWGDLLNGELFATEHGAPWCRARDAADAGLRPSYHNDGSVSPPSPLGNIKTVVTRTSQSGTEHGPEQAVTIDEALRAHTIDAAFILGRDHELGSIEVGKFADFVQLDRDPHDVDPMELATAICVQGTWLAGERVDPVAFQSAAGVADPAPHAHLTRMRPRCC